ncbi:hypothetical protein BIW11_02495 [Tropilaelaps mercedesae]|uniref:Uncharacterized protein n=1 Tax=Tropilaelaps mercedesae TaxID=418985 RepID=A0A1V9Y252_9ACAR|nr:hypothetical protein BIW11_02495 [Tropilaelaps mercedesae]
MPKAEKVSRSSSDISLASTVALDDFAHNVEPTFDVTDATIIARQSEIEEMRNFVRKQKTKLFVLMDNYVDFVAHQVVAVMNTVVRYKEVNEEARVARRDDKIVKNESPFFYKVKFNILPVFHDLAIHINNYSQVSDDIELQKCLCQQTKQKMDNIYKLIAYLMDGDPILENDVKNNKLPDQTSSHSGPGSCKGRIVSDLHQGFGLHVIDVESLLLQRSNHIEPTLENFLELVEREMRNGSSEAGFLIDLVPNLRCAERCIAKSNVRLLLGRFERDWPVAFALTLYGKLFLHSTKAEQILLDLQVEGANDERDANRIRRRCTTFAESVQPVISYFRDRTVRVQHDGNDYQRLWDTVADLFWELGFKARGPQLSLLATYASGCRQTFCPGSPGGLQLVASVPC